MIRKIRKKTVPTRERRENFRMFVRGAVIGVIGNMLVSFSIENIRAEGLFSRTVWLSLTALSGALFFHMLLTIGREMQFSVRQMKGFKVSRVLLPISCVVAWLIEYMPAIFSFLTR